MVTVALRLFCIISDCFVWQSAKDSGKYIEEKKLRLVLISPPNSPVLLPANGMLKQDPCYETPMQKDKVLSGVENIPTPDKVTEIMISFYNFILREHLLPFSLFMLIPCLIR